jgi:hypothetical protein
MLATDVIERRLAAIRRRIVALQMEMSARGTSDPCIELVREHGALVRERNTILSTKGTR